MCLGLAPLLIAQPGAVGARLSSGPVPAADNASVPVAKAVQSELAREGAADFWVDFEDEADLSGAKGMGWAERGQYVYDALTTTAKTSQAEVVEELSARAADYESFWIVNAVVVRGGDQATIDAIRAETEVAAIRADEDFELPDPIETKDTDRVARVNAVEWGIANIRADQVWDTLGVRDEGIVVGNIDTGVQYDHPALVGQYRGNLGDATFDHDYSWWDPSGVCPASEPCDNNNHGTHTMGTMVGDDGAGNQIGVAPGARWIAAKGCESSTCSSAALLSSGQFMLAPTDLSGQSPRPDLRPNIVNNSWGEANGALVDPFYREMVTAWTAAGIFGVFSNGNDGPGCDTTGSPADYVESWSVGAYDSAGTIASFSSRGPGENDEIRPSISAPGVAVRSSIRNNSYGTLNGTSMAAPHQSGAIALMWSAAPALVGEVDGTRQVLAGTALDVANTTCGGTAENNNVHGEGRLDAFAAVEASPRGAVGSLTGTVTAADTNAPIAGATVTVTGEVDRERTTGSDGTYSIILPVGDYSVTASAFGYADQTAQATIAEDQTTTQDFPLPTVPSVTVSGQVTDGSGHGWPLYATIEAQGTPVSTFTDPLTGQYEVQLPVNDTYTLAVSSQYPGYTRATETVDIADSVTALDFALVSDSCQAPGYRFSGDIAVLGDLNGQLGDFLNSRGIPASVFNWGDDPSQYDAIIVNAPDNPGRQPFLDFLADTDAAGTGVVFLDTLTDSLGSGIRLLVDHVGIPTTRGAGRDTSKFPYLSYRVLEEHPVLDGVAVGDETIFSTTGPRDHAWFFGYTGEGRTVIANREVAGSPITPQSGIGVQDRDNNRHVLLSMHGVSTRMSPADWTDDGGRLLVNALEWAGGTALECGLVDGGLVLGSVNDLNTGAGVNGATVSSAEHPADHGRSFATPEDPALDDGFYWLFSSGTGSQALTATASNYLADTHPVTVAADEANEASFTLGAGQLTVTPTELELQLRLGQTGRQSFTIRNTGTAPAQLDLAERRGDFEILGGGHHQITGTAEPQYVNGELSLAANPTANPTDSGPASAPGVRAGPSADPWIDLADHPQNIMDNSAAVVDDVVYSFGGYNGVSRLPHAYAFDPTAGEWSPVANMPAERMKPEAVEIDGLVYLLGGWDNAGVTHATVFVYDPAADSYSQVADMPAGRTAFGAAVSDGQLYVVGGCTTAASCTPIPRTVWRYDPGTDSWETLADYPETAAWLGCAGLGGRVYCAGGSDGDDATTGTYVYNPGSNTWTEVASMPYDNWAMAADAANGQLVVSGGVTNGTVTNRGAAYSPATDAWTAIEPSNNIVYRMGSVCGYYKIGGSTGGFAPTVGVEQHPGFAECGVEAVPWVTVDPLTATLAPGESVTVTVLLDSGAADEQQPGTYTAGVAIAENTPYRVDPVDVTMNVTPPNSWGKITGTVTGIDCAGNNSPLSGATLQINSRQLAVTLSTGADGGYAHWMAVNSNPLQVIAAGDGHIPQARKVSIVPGQNVVEDFTLSRRCAG